MTRTTTRRCGQCGARAVGGVARAGRLTMYRNLELEVPAHVVVPTCAKCGAEWIDEAAAKALDEALERVYESKLRTRLDAALEKILSEEGSQARVERVLGVSPGYLSKLKLGRRSPSAEIVWRWPWCPRAPNADWRSWTISTTPPGHANAPPARNWKFNLGTSAQGRREGNPRDRCHRPRQATGGRRDGGSTAPGHGPGAWHCRADHQVAVRATAGRPNTDRTCRPCGRRWLYVRLKMLFSI